VNLQMVGFVYGFSGCSVYLCPGDKCLYLCLVRGGAAISCEAVLGAREWRCT